MINENQVYRIIDLAVRIGRCGSAPSLKDEIQTLQYQLNDLKAEWRRCASEEYAADRLILEIEGLRNAGWTAKSLLAERRKGGFGHDEQIMSKWFKYSQEFIERTPNLDKVFV